MDQISAAALLLAQGKTAEAERIAADAIEKQPQDAGALGLLAMAALQRADVRAARGYLERAVAVVPGDGFIQHNLGRIRQIDGDYPAAVAADSAAVAAAPGEPSYRLHYGLTLADAGQHPAAALQCLRALRQAQADGRWLNPDNTPEPLRPLVERAVTLVRAYQHEVMDRVLDPLVARYGRSSLDRIEAALRIYIGEQQPVYADERQKPTFFYIPGVPPRAYFDRRLFPWIRAYEAAFAAIRQELEGLLPTPQGRERVFGSEELEKENLRGENIPPTWNGYYFYRHGKRREDNCQACPQTARALDVIDLARIREHGPEVLFSVFTAGTHLLPHRGVTNARLVSHLPLIVPEDCALSVGGEVHQWREGRVVVFDDTYMHEAWNRSGTTRVVLIADVWNPLLTEAEQHAVSDVIPAIGDINAQIDGL